MTPSEAVENAKEKARDVAADHGAGGSRTKKVLLPIAASILSGAAAYGARKAPELVQERLVPKLKEAAGEGGILEKAKDALEGIVPTSTGSADGSSRGPGERAQRSMSHEQRERERRERAERRKARRKALAR